MAESKVTVKSRADHLSSLLSGALSSYSLRGQLYFRDQAFIRGYTFTFFHKKMHDFVIEIGMTEFGNLEDPQETQRYKYNIRVGISKRDEREKFDMQDMKSKFDDIFNKVSKEIKPFKQHYDFRIYTDYPVSEYPTIIGLSRYGADTSDIDVVLGDLKAFNKYTSDLTFEPVSDKTEIESSSVLGHRLFSLLTDNSISGLPLSISDFDLDPKIINDQIQNNFESNYRDESPEGKSHFFITTKSLSKELLYKIKDPNFNFDNIFKGGDSVFHKDLEKVIKKGWQDLETSFVSTKGMGYSAREVYSDYTFTEFDISEILDPEIIDDKLRLAVYLDIT